MKVHSANIRVKVSYKTEEKHKELIKLALNTFLKIIQPLRIELVISGFCLI